MKINDEKENNNENENEKNLNVYNLKIYIGLKVLGKEKSKKKSFKIFN